MQALNTTKRQLRAYYARLGWGRKRTEKAVKADLCAILRHVGAGLLVRRRVRDFLRDPGLQAVGAQAWFVWHNTPEGHTYWAHRFGYF